jgi:hypothetical protein
LAITLPSTELSIILLRILGNFREMQLVAALTEAVDDLLPSPGRD